MTHICLYGSRVYSTATDTSDYDYHHISSTYNAEFQDRIVDDNRSIDITYLPLNQFIEEFNNCQVRALEIYFTPNEFIDQSLDQIKELKFVLNDETRKLIRKAFATKSDWTEVRARKKLRDGEKRIAIKSLWHSYRIIKFAMDIHEHGSIINWSCANDMWDELMKINEDDYSEEMFRGLYKKYLKENGLMTQFKNAFPLK